ncbi:MAG TPA: hypothetical protein VNR64_18825 [Vicinamibacterales bacterium]|nr:hypothetical protein [Vicinamibacterales bacterium]
MAITLLVWLILALVLSLTGTLHALPVRMPILAALLTGVVLIVVALSASARSRALAGGPRPLVAFHLTRFVGFYFLWLYHLGVLARNFAVPAGWGDVIIAAWAVALLLIRDWTSREMRLAVLLWNAFGLFDILLVVALAARQAAADPGFQNGFASLPLSLLPTFIVPLVIASHALLFVWLGRKRV